MSTYNGKGNSIDEKLFWFNKYNNESDQISKEFYLSKYYEARRKVEKDTTLYTQQSTNNDSCCSIEYCSGVSRSSNHDNCGTLSSIGFSANGYCANFC